MKDHQASVETMSAVSDPVSRMIACLWIFTANVGLKSVIETEESAVNYVTYVCGDSENVACGSECHPWPTTSCKIEKTWFRHPVQTILDAPDTEKRWIRSSSKQTADLKLLAFCQLKCRGSSLKVILTVRSSAT